MVLDGHRLSLNRPFGWVGTSSSIGSDCRWNRFPVAVRRNVAAWRELLGTLVPMCLKHSCPQGSEYPKHGPEESQSGFVSFMKDKTRFCTSIIEGLRSGTCVGRRVFGGSSSVINDGIDEDLFVPFSGWRSGVDSVALPFPSTSALVCKCP